MQQLTPAPLAAGGEGAAVWHPLMSAAHTTTNHQRRIIFRLPTYGRSAANGRARVSPTGYRRPRMRSNPHAQIVRSSGA